MLLLIHRYCIKFYIPKFFLTFICSVFFLTSTAFASLNLELTQSVGLLPPVVLAGFKLPASISDSNIIDIVAKDLSNSGEFKVIKDKDFVVSLDNIAKLQKSGASYIAVAEINNLAKDSYTLSLTFYNISLENNLDFALPVSSTKFIFSTADIVEFSHIISDNIYKSITGVDGLFSTKLAYISTDTRPGMKSKYNLEVADYDGSNSKIIVQSYEPILSPNWSPDGAKIAYVTYDDNKQVIYVQNIASGNREKFSVLPGINSSPRWSHDGSRMALVLSESGSVKIYIIDLKTKDITVLDEHGISAVDSDNLVTNSHKAYSSSGYAIDTEPVWSYDDTSLFFTSNRSGDPQIYSYNFGKNLVARVTYRGVYNASSDITSDGRYLISLHREGGLHSIAMHDLFHEQQMRIISQDGYEESPSLTPNGKNVVFATNYGARDILAMASLDGNIRWRLPDLRMAVADPAWGPLLYLQKKFLIDDVG